MASLSSAYGSIFFLALSCVLDTVRVAIEVREIIDGGATAAVLFGSYQVGDAIGDDLMKPRITLCRNSNYRKLAS
jgi:hypothetical protein